MINVNLMPKTLRRRKTFDPYKAVAIGVPLLALLVCGFMQISLMNHTRGLRAYNRELQNEKAVLQPFIDEQERLRAEQVELQQVKTITDSVRTGRILWSRQLFAMLETRPTPGTQLASRMTFTSLEMRALDAATQAQLKTDNTYEGLDVIAEMNVTGLAGSTEVVSDYIRELQDAPNFSVVLSDLAQTEESLYTFNLTIGSGRLERQQPAAQASLPTTESTQ